MELLKNPRKNENKFPQRPFSKGPKTNHIKSKPKTLENPNKNHRTPWLLKIIEHFLFWKTIENPQKHKKPIKNQSPTKPTKTKPQLVLRMGLRPGRWSRPSSKAKRKSAKSATRVRRRPSGTEGPEFFDFGPQIGPWLVGGVRCVCLFYF